MFVEALDARARRRRHGHPLRRAATPATSPRCASSASEHGFEVVALDDVGERASAGPRRWVRAAALARRRRRRGAAQILGRPHRVVGTVVHGDHRGRELGYPTANLLAGLTRAWCPPTACTPAGCSGSTSPEGDPDRTLPAAIIVGTNPTFDGTPAPGRGLRARPHRPRPLRRARRGGVRRAPAADPEVRVDRRAASSRWRRTSRGAARSSPRSSRPSRARSRGPPRRAGGARRAGTGPRAGPSWLRLDLGLLIGALGLSVVGVVLVWSATRASSGGTAALKQLVALGVGMACAAAVTRLDVRTVRAVAPVVYVLAVLGLAAVVSPLGSTVNGSRSWIRLPGGMSLQPSELMKVALAVGLAMLLAERAERGLRQRHRDVVLAWVVAGIPIVLVLAQPRPLGCR